jgi:hypothetical protein
MLRSAEAEAKRDPARIARRHRTSLFGAASGPLRDSCGAGRATHGHTL